MGHIKQFKIHAFVLESLLRRENATCYNGGLWGPHEGASRVGGFPDLSGLALGLGGDPHKRLAQLSAKLTH
ncbi:hypothetical protein BZZ01_02370 [Nostocales cyanobacterium HT-58-2]|nr:hypothetical protein BZZ01_02370 [Nostocales cyanobacterium HT-58-2]